MKEPSSRYVTVTFLPRWTSLKDTLMPPLENTPLTVAVPLKWGELSVHTVPAIREVNTPPSTILRIWICMVESPCLKISAARNSVNNAGTRIRNPLRDEKLRVLLITLEG